MSERKRWFLKALCWSVTFGLVGAFESRMHPVADIPAIHFLHDAGLTLLAFWAARGK